MSDDIIEAAQQKIMSDGTCQCPRCGRLHHKLDFGKPPAAISGEFAWCIERGDSQPAAPTYWAGPDRWSQDNIDAVRFARKQDAERVACRLGQGYHRVCEHGWG